MYHVCVCFLQVIIQGFRSYRDQTIIEPFSPKHNVISKSVIDNYVHVDTCVVISVTKLVSPGPNASKYLHSLVHVLQSSNEVYGPALKQLDPQRVQILRTIWTPQSKVLLKYLDPLWNKWTCSDFRSIGLFGH